MQDEHQVQTRLLAVWAPLSDLPRVTAFDSLAEM